MKILQNFALIIIALTLSVAAIAQNKVIGQPIKFQNPKDFLNEDDMKQFIQGKGKESKENAWIVVSDRMNNQTYKKGDENSEAETKINFKDWFYVTPK